MAKHINLQLGWPSTSLFPASQLLNGASNILKSQDKTAAALIYGPDAGYAPLRGRIADWLSTIYNASAPLSVDRICISNGASGNLGNVLAKFTEPGYTRAIWMVEPCYFLACPIFMDAGFEGSLRGIPEDEEGLDIDFLRSALSETEKGSHPEAPKLKTHERYGKLYKHVIYAVPTFANPSGKTMSLRRRQDLVRLAREYDALIVTDDVYDILRWPRFPNQSQPCGLGAVPPRIVDVDRTLDGGPIDEWGNAVSNGSFSKIIAPGVRTGWAEGTPSFALALSTVGATRSGGSPSHLTATFIDEMMATGRLDAHIRDTLIPTYSSRYYATMEAIDKHLVPLGFKLSTGLPYDAAEATPSSSGGKTETNGHSAKEASAPAAGGYFTYLTLPSDLPLSGPDLAALALERYNLKFAFGAMMAVEGDEGSSMRAKDGYGRGIRLCWSWHDEDTIVEGIERLATVVKDVRAR